MKTWTNETCEDEAKKYKTRKDFKIKSTSAYKYAVRNNILEDVCTHMKQKQKEPGYWTKERCQEESLKYKHRKEFQKNSGSAYNVASKNGWLDEICSHMLVIGNLKNRCIYAIEFDDNFVYIGLTYDINRRLKRHLDDINSKVYKHKLETGLDPKIKKLTDYIDYTDASILEGYYLNKYKENNWNILNYAKTGGLGGNNLIWTKEKCEDEAKKYSNRFKFNFESPSAYRSALKNGWLDEICKHMISTMKKHGHWTKEKCEEEAKKYKSKKEFNEKSSGAYWKASVNKWLDEICNHMVSTMVNPHGYWTYEKCKEIALKYENISEFRKTYSGAYSSAWKNGWLNDICSHMGKHYRKNYFKTKKDTI